MWKSLPHCSRRLFRIVLLAPLSIVIVAFVVGCRDTSTDEPSPGSSADALRVVCTTGQVADLVANVGGAHVSVESLMGPGVDPHLYRPTPGDLAKLNLADLIFYNGLHLEGRLSDVLESLGRKKPVFAVSASLEAENPSRLRATSEFAGNYDPHIWFDAALWADCAREVAAVLSEHDPAHADDYQQNAEQYAAELQALADECRERIAEIPERSRVLVTAHDAFGYFGEAYGMEVHALQGISTLDEADLQNINELVDLLVERGIKAIFVESSVPPKNIESLKQGCAARGHQVAIGGELYSDALGPAGTPEGTYIGMMRYNVNTIVEALR